jgi:hypothetical protein
VCTNFACFVVCSHLMTLLARSSRSQSHYNMNCGFADAEPERESTGAKMQAVQIELEADDSTEGKKDDGRD